MSDSNVCDETKSEGGRRGARGRPTRLGFPPENTIRLGPGSILDFDHVISTGNFSQDGLDGSSRPGEDGVQAEQRDGEP